METVTDPEALEAQGSSARRTKRPAASFASVRLTPASWRTGAIVVAAYALLSILAYLPVLPFDNSHILSTAPNDATDVGWFMSWVGFAVTHGHNPFFTNWMDFPSGINIPANQSVPLLGAVLSPIQEIFGPFAMMNFAMHLSFVASGSSMYLALRKLDVGRLAAFIGGLYFGFCPFMIAHSLENPNFTFLPALPFIFLYAFRLIEGRSARPRREGVLLGVACAIQLYLNPEPLAEILVVLVVAAVLAVLWRWRRVTTSELVALGRNALVALVVFVVIGIPFAYYYLAGPQHISGPVVGLQYLAVDHSDLAQLIVPDRNQLIGTAHLIAVGNAFTGGAINETGSYLGITLLLGLVVFAIRYWRVRAVRFSVVTGIVGYILSLSAQLYVNNHATGITLPGTVLLHLPVLSSAETVRYFVVTDIAVAVVLAKGLECAALDLGPRWQRLRLGGRQLPAAALVCVLAAVLLFPLIPRWPYPWNLTEVPQYFTSNEVDAIAPNATLLTYPIAQSGAVNPMQWQMEANFRFKILSGYGYVANNGGVQMGNPPMLPDVLSTLENDANNNLPQSQYPAFSLRDLLRIREVLQNFRVDDFVMLPQNQYQIVEHYLSVALGVRPQSIGGVLVWYHIPELLKTSLHATIIEDRRSGLITKYPPVGPGYS